MILLLLLSQKCKLLNDLKSMFAAFAWTTHDPFLKNAETASQLSSHTNYIGRTLKFKRYKYSHVI